MLLSAELRLQLQNNRGLYVTECCDRCGKLLGPVRFMRRGDAEVWCSRECRDGMAAAEKRILSRGGRPRVHGSNAEKQKAYRAKLECYETTKLTLQNV
jgi:hypothetical protein